MRVQPTYSSDPTPQEWAIIEPVLKHALGDKRKGAPCRYSLYDLYRAMRYILANGVSWRSLPRDLPPWQVVYYHFHRWKELGIWDQVEQALEASAHRNKQQGKSKTATGDH